MARATLRLIDRVLAELEDHRGRVALVIDDLHELHSPDALAQLTLLLTSLPLRAAARLGRQDPVAAVIEIVLTDRLLKEQ